MCVFCIIFCILQVVTLAHWREDDVDQGRRSLVYDDATYAHHRGCIASTAGTQPNVSQPPPSPPPPPIPASLCPLRLPWHCIALPLRPPTTSRPSAPSPSANFAPASAHTHTRTRTHTHAHTYQARRHGWRLRANAPHGSAPRRCPPQPPCRCCCHCPWCPTAAAAPPPPHDRVVPTAAAGWGASVQRRVAVGPRPRVLAGDRRGDAGAAF